MKKIIIAAIFFLLIMPCVALAVSEGNITTDNIVLEDEELTEDAEEEIEILFRGIPWGISILGVREQLAEQLICESNSTIETTPILGEFTIDDFDSVAYASDLEDYDTVGFEITIYTIPDEITLAGHTIGWLEVSGICGIVNDEISREKEDSIFYEAFYFLNATDGKAVYDDLKTKLTNLYGEAIETQDVSNYLNASFVDTTDRATWHGVNNTGVYIEREWRQEGNKQSEKAFRVYYGKSGMTDHFVQLDELIKQENLQKEQEKLEENINNIDGL